MTLTRRRAGWACCAVCVCARVRGVMVAGSAALASVCVGARWACKNVKNLVCVIRATYDALIVSAVSSAVSRVLCRSIAIAALCLPRVRRCAALCCGCCVTAQRYVRLCSRLIARVCASRCAALCARVRYRRVAVGERCCVCVVGGGGGGGRWQSMLRTSVTCVQ